MATEIIPVPMYNGEINIKFYPNSHKYKIDWSKDWLYSVSSITGIVDKPWLKQWAVNCACDYLLKQSSITAGTIEHIRKFWAEETDDALNTGKQLHDYLEWFSKYKMNGWEKPVFPTDEKARKALTGFLDWYTSHDITFIEAEKLIYSREYNYVWRFDILYKIDGKLILSDWKTSKTIYPEYINQVVGYAIAYEEEHNIIVDWVSINRFDKESWEFDSFTVLKDDPVYIEAKNCFLACLQLKRTMAKFDWLLKLR